MNVDGAAEGARPWAFAGACFTVGLLAARVIRTVSSRSEVASKLTDAKEAVKEKISEGKEAVASKVTDASKAPSRRSSPSRPAVKEAVASTKGGEELSDGREEPEAPGGGLGVDQASPEAPSPEEIHPAGKF